MKNPRDDWREKEFEDEANAEAQAAIWRFLKTLDHHESPTPRQRAERRGLKVIEGGKKA